MECGASGAGELLGEVRVRRDGGVEEVETPKFRGEERVDGDAATKENLDDCGMTGEVCRVNGLRPKHRVRVGE